MPGEPSTLRESMKAMSGKLLDVDSQEFDLTAWYKAATVSLAALNTSLANILERLNVSYTQEGVAVLDFIHHEIHEGDAYQSDAVKSIIAGGTLILAFKTADDPREMHFLVEYACQGPSHMDLLEGPTWTTGTGSQNPVYNRDRNSAKTSLVLEDTTGAFVANMDLVRDPTGLAGGTILLPLYAWSEKRAGDSEKRDEQEYILKRNTQYAVRLTNDDTTVNGGELLLNWYEHSRE